MLDKIVERIKNDEKVIKRMLVALVIFIIIIIAYITAEALISYTINGTINNNIKNVETQVEEKQKIIEDLNNQLNDLKNKQQELETKIEEVKISKAEKKVTVTSRGGSSSATKKTTVQANATISGNEQWIWANVSAYCACVKCCGKTNGITASGTKATAGRTIAASKTYAFGTKIEIAGMGTYVVEDRGSAITGNKIDIYFDNHTEALQFGRRNLQIRVVE